MNTSTKSLLLVVVFSILFSAAYAAIVIIVAFAVPNRLSPSDGSSPTEFAVPARKNKAS